MRGAEFTPDFRKILATRTAGTKVSMNTIRDDLAAAGIPPICGGALLRWARDRGYLQWAGTEASDRGNPLARGRPVQVYARTDVEIQNAPSDTPPCTCGGTVVPETNRGIEHHICTQCSACDICDGLSDEPCLCGTGFTCLAAHHDGPVR